MVVDVTDTVVVLLVVEVDVTDAGVLLLVLVGTTPTPVTASGMAGAASSFPAASRATL
jgi:hypothetical protein